LSATAPSGHVYCAVSATLSQRLCRRAGRFVCKVGETAGPPLLRIAKLNSDRYAGYDDWTLHRAWPTTRPVAHERQTHAWIKRIAKADPTFLFADPDRYDLRTVRPRSGERGERAVEIFFAPPHRLFGYLDRIADQGWAEIVADIERKASRRSGTAGRPTSKGRGGEGPTDHIPPSPPPGPDLDAENPVEGRGTAAVAADTPLAFSADCDAVAAIRQALTALDIETIKTIVAATRSALAGSRIRRGSDRWDDLQRGVSLLRLEADRRRRAKTAGHTAATSFSLPSGPPPAAATTAWHRAVVACRAVFTDPQLAAARIARHLTEGDDQALRLRLAEAPGDFGRPRPIKRSRRPRYLIVDNASLRDALVDALLAWKALTES